ncbi:MULTISPECIES: hypothetical protein [unclassified Lentimonas]|uniref:hypothetical protein n=1 Tax=unclassified Lentimonas TaxID=2630993 RepID=UPI00132C111B|nr:MULTISPECIES: hypothetical protein [unclassified Lentimonas]CAA6677416.1 Unannotated [Lentimonas sp. CC4]CAA6686386.1 Unannotated [Lentimonas sp. CC6]CAA6690150.1 Unannotated [Lentimonas sp. CC19]CAA6690891.1 Unannotated [Lentimonas sp. CC10]CAA7068448.1 Unannotated [Lentimonas sp. CC11]
MAKKPQKLEPLTLQEIILRGDSETIRQALEARVQIDTLLEEREAAYRRIAELETQVSEIVGEDGIFPFPAPPLDVADYVKKPAPKKAAAPKPAPVVVKSEAPAAEDKPADKEDAQAEAVKEDTKDETPEVKDDAADKGKKA